MVLVLLLFLSIHSFFSYLFASAVFLLGLNLLSSLKFGTDILFQQLELQLNILGLFFF